VGELTQRQKAIATAVVAEHIETAEPVGSETLRRRCGFACSSATIRNEMARLEERGYLSQPHTSAGRIPLRPAYRLHVDELRTEGQRLDRDVTWIQGELRRVAGQQEAMLRLSSAILSRITRYPAVVISPQSRGPRLIDLSLTPVSANNVLVSYLDDRGVTEEVLVETSAPVRADELARIEELLHERVVGAPLGADLGLEDLEGCDPALVEGLRDAFNEAGSGRVYVEGTTFVLDQPEFEDPESLRRMIGALSRSPLLRRALDAVAGEQGSSASIGEEHGVEALSDCSVVAASYRVDDRRRGTVGVVGPMRMHYALALEMVATLARNLGQALSTSAQDEDSTDR